MIKYICIIFTLFIFTSSDKPINDARDFHVNVVGEKQVEIFELKFPQIVNNRKTYIAYLQQYYTNNESEFINLLKEKHNERCKRD